MDYLEHAKGILRDHGAAEGEAVTSAVIAIAEQLKRIADAMEHTAVNQAVGVIEKGAKVTGVKIDRLG